jgi:alpha 1,3-glucosidase
MAVDRSKFRTCEQTSFCRRHRHGKSRALYNYKIVPESVEIVRNRNKAAEVVVSSDELNSGESTGSAGADAATTNNNESGGGGLRSKLSRMLPKSIGLLNRDDKDTLHQQHQQEGDDVAADPYVRGPSPFLTATLVNVAPFTSTALTARVYGNCNAGSSGSGSSSSNGSFVETLKLAVHLHEDGVARIRITEMLEHESATGGGPRSTPRWTSDELVLNEKEMVGVNYDHVRVISTNLMILPSSTLDSTTDNNNDNVQNNVAILSPLIDRANLGIGVLPSSPSNTVDNFIVLSYSGGETMEQFQLMLRLEPFAAFFFRGSDDDGGPPAIVAGTGGLTHFEVRRNKKMACPNNDGEDGKSDVEPAGGGEVEFEVDITGESTSGIVEEETETEEEDRHGGKEIVGYWEDGLAIYADGTREERRIIENMDTASNGGGEFDTKDMWEERFGDHIDSKPHGPMSVGMELTFPSSKHLFGLPEHASSTQLKTTKGVDGVRYYNEPYRLYNLDVFEYELDETMALYGHVPLIVSQSITTGTAGAFWFNPTETFVDIEDGQGDDATKAHFSSESGIIDLFLLPGPDPATMYAQYARLTGRMPLPPMFSLGYHQCRWNYRDEADVYQVHSKFEELDYPYDVLWLDIEHTDGKRYFTWDQKAFPNPEEMQRKLGMDGRRMVTIIDPHIKRDDNYYIHKEATALGLYIKDKKAEKDFDGWCWPGSSSYLDFTTEKVRSWWAEQFQYKKYTGSTPELFTWNDMNEPSVFNGPEVSMQKDLLNLNKCEHREWHNLYGMLFHRSTTEGLIKRNEGENVRPFVLSRAFFAGSQRHGAIWTGDNEAKWSHLEIAAPMLLGLNVGALSFVGADVGGFFGNTDAELMTRWMQAGAYQPFFRGHAHHDAKRREPWMFGDETMVRLKRAAMARYALLPYWYTVFWQAGATGMPVMR